MKTTITKENITQYPVVEQLICSYDSVTIGSGKLLVLTDIITKKVAFKVIGDIGELIVQDLDEAINSYNLMQL